MTTVNLTRQTIHEPWGLKILGGRDFRVPLQIKKVDPNSPAAAYLNNGDAIKAIGGMNADNLTHSQASQMIKSAGNHLQLTILPGQFQEVNLQNLKPKGPIKFSPWRNKQQ